MKMITEDFWSLIGRYYDPATDQFLSVDPDLGATGQPYAFTGDDPLNSTDPKGLASVAGPDGMSWRAWAESRSIRARIKFGNDWPEKNLQKAI